MRCRPWPALIRCKVWTYLAPGLPRAFDVNFVIPLLVNDDDVCWGRLKLTGETSRVLHARRNSKIFRTRRAGGFNERFYRVPEYLLGAAARITKMKRDGTRAEITPSRKSRVSSEQIRTRYILRNNGEKRQSTSAPRPISGYSIAPAGRIDPHVKFPTKIQQFFSRHPKVPARARARGHRQRVSGRAEEK